MDWGKRGVEYVIEAGGEKETWRSDKGVKCKGRGRKGLWV